QFPVNRLTLAINHKDKYEDFLETNFVNRLISGALPDKKGILLFEPDIKEGDEVLFMLRNGSMMIDSVKKNTRALFDEIISNGDKPVFSLYIDCAGRASTLSETLSEEASEVQNICNQYDVPLLGFYSGVEIAPVQGKSRGLDWTGVLLTLAEE
ncbi:MAG: FIST C-terminal domain-containing protein, partial [Desulfobacteraceae bacterium]